MIIKLTKSKEALVSDEDFDFLSQWKWSALETRGTYYAVRGGVKGYFYMHREIAKRTALEGDMVDHIDGDRLNNTRSNLRGCTNAENLQNRGKPSNNTSGVKGVHWDKARSKWKAEIQAGGEKYYLGRFDILVDAKTAYKRAARKLHKEFCYDRNC